MTLGDGTEKEQQQQEEEEEEEVGEGVEGGPRGGGGEGGGGLTCWLDPVCQLSCGADIAGTRIAPSNAPGPPIPAPALFHPAEKHPIYEGFNYQDHQLKKKNSNTKKKLDQWARDQCVSV